jgi:hypothetical protein
MMSLKFDVVGLALMRMNVIIILKTMLAIIIMP